MRCDSRVLVTVLASLGLSSLSLGAQTVLSVEGGASIAKWGGRAAGGTSSRTGLAAGVSLTFPVSELLGVQVGAAYVQKGADFSVSGMNAEVAIDYLQVPVLLYVRMPSSGRVSAHVLVGPAVGFQTKCNGKVSGSGVTQTFSCGSPGPGSRTVDLGAMGGLGIGIDVAPKLRIVVEALYNLGLTSISKGGADYRNRAFTIRAGLAVPLG